MIKESLKYYLFLRSFLLVMRLAVLILRIDGLPG